MNAETKIAAPPADYFQSRRSDVERLLPVALQRVLEVGCGAGAFSASLAAGGAEVWGVEPNAEAADIARKCLTKVITGTFEQASEALPDGYFDLVVCNDVIEHMPDHDAFLQRVKAKMAPGAHLVGSLPNIRHITALVKILVLRDFPYREEGILDRTHLRFFTRKSIVRALEQNGYRIEALKGVNNIITEGVCRGSAAQKLFWRVVTSAVVALSLGFYADTMYPQFAFRAKLDEE